MKPGDIQFALAGVSFRRGNFKDAMLAVGDVLDLKPEPENKFDPNAIAVYKGTLHIGYVPKDWNHALRGTTQCCVEAVNKHGAGLSATLST